MLKICGNQNEVQKMKKAKIGAIPFLNAKPIFYGLELNGGDDIIEVSHHLPADNVQLLNIRQLEAAVVPSIEYARAESLYIVPGICIASDGPVGSVKLLSNVELSAVSTITVDSRSRTSVALLRILCIEKYDIEPEFREEDTSDGTIPSGVDAAMMIGDEALYATGTYKEIRDLGEDWTNLTSFPFVYAFIAGRQAALQKEHVLLLQNSLQQGLVNVSKIAENHPSPSIADAALLNEKYLTDNIRFRLDERELDGLKLFYIKAWEHGIIESIPHIRFYSS
jgi:chorismate dehydratase